MFTKWFYQLLRVAITISNKIGAVPFTFDRSQNLLIPPSRFTLKFYKLNVLAIIFSQLFQIFQAIRFRFIGPPDKFNFSYTFAIGSVIILCGFSITSLFSQELRITMNGVFQYFQLLQRKTFVLPQISNLNKT